MSTGAESVDEALSALYAAPLEEFVARRDAAAKQRKAAGDAAGAKRISAAHKPTQAAWALNALARENEPELTSLLQAGAAVARAQQSGKAVLEALAAHRAAGQAMSLALAKALERHQLPAGLLHELLPFLQTASVDPALGAMVKAGQLSKVPEPSVGFFGLSAATAAAPAARAAPAVEPPHAQSHGESQRQQQEREAARQAALEARRAEAVAGEQAAQARVDAARQALEQANTRERESEAEVARAERMLAQARERNAEASAAAKRAQAGLRDAEKEHRETKAQLEQLGS